MTPPWFLLLLAALCAGPACRAEEALSAVLRPAAVVEGAVAKLGELAEIRGGTPAQQAALQALPVAPAPLPGYTSAIALAQVQRAVRAQLHPVALQYGGARLVQVERASAVLPAAQAQQAALAYVQRVLGAAGYAVSARADGVPAALSIPLGKLSLEPVAMAPAQLLRARVVVRLNVLVDAAQFGVLAVPLALEARAPVLQARRDLAAGALLHCEDIEPATADLALLGAEPTGTRCEEGAWRLRAPLLQGEVLLARMVEAAPAVQRGQAVQLRFETGAIVLESLGVALADGQVGQRIAVRATHSKEELSGEITSAGKVMVLRR